MAASKSVTVPPVRFVLHLQDWWCVGKRETSFPVNKLLLIYLQPSLWPSTMFRLILQNVTYFTKTLSLAVC